MNRKMYTNVEDNVILTHVKQNFQNVSYALELAAKELKRTTSSVSARYYGTLVKSNNTMMLVSRSGKGIMNRKVVARTKSEPLMLEVIKEMTIHMTREQKKELIKVLVSSE